MDVSIKLGPKFSVMGYIIVDTSAWVTSMHVGEFDNTPAVYEHKPIGLFTNRAFPFIEF